MKIKVIYNNRYKIRIWWLLAIFTIIIAVSLFYVNFLRDLIYRNTYDNISELSMQTTNQLNNSIDTQKQFVQQMVDFIDKGYAKTPEEVFERFKDVLDDYHITRLVILDKNGNGSTSDGFTVENYKNMEEFFAQNEVYLSENRPSTVSDNQVNIYSKTFKFQNKDLVLFATINTANYKDILTRRLFNGQGGTYLINNNGSILIDSFNIVTENNVNLYDFMKEQNGTVSSHSSEQIDIMSNNIKNKINGTFDAKFNSNTYFIHYEKLSENDWYVVTIAPASIIAKELNLFLGISLGLCFLINIIIIGTFIYIDISTQKQNHKLYKAAYIDPITSLGNETFFKETGAKYLQNSSNNKYMISLDINKFKALNNIYGYDFCNVLLKSIGQKLLEVFPSNIIANMFGFKPEAFFQIDEASREVPKVQF